MIIKSWKNYEKRWFIRQRINPLKFNTVQEFNSATGKKIIYSTFLAYKRIWRSIGLTDQEVIIKPTPRKITVQKAPESKLVEKVSKKKEKPKKEIIKPPVLVKEIEEVTKKEELSQFIFDKFVINSKKNKQPLLKIFRIMEPKLKNNELIISYYLNFHTLVPKLLINETFSKNINVSIKFPKGIENSLQNDREETKQVWSILPEISKNSYIFGYICSGNNVLNDIPVEISIPDVKISLLNQKISGPAKSEFFLPELHQLLQKVALEPKKKNVILPELHRFISTV